MSQPLFLHFYSNGKVYISNELAFTPGVASQGSSKFKTEAGTAIGVFRINSDADAQLVTTLSGTVSSSLAVSGATGKNGKELV